MEIYEKKINKILPLSKSNLFYKNKLILSEKTLVKLKKSIKENIKKPNKDIEVFIIRAKFDPEDDDYYLSITLSMNNLTPEYELNPILGFMKNFVYTKKDFIKYGFKKSHLNKMIKAIKNRTISFRKIGSSINEILKDN